MPAKQLIFSEEARRSLKKGIDVMAEAVGTTLGAEGTQRGPGQEVGSPHHHS